MMMLLLLLMMMIMMMMMIVDNYDNGNKIMIRVRISHNKRSMDLGALLDTCNWCDKWQFSADLFHHK